jgi:hypothetical protein
LRDAIASGDKKILVLINPPYKEAGAGSGLGGKAGISSTKVAQTGLADYGKANNELFVQFLARISREIPTATIAMFSKLKYVNATNFETFRENWNAQYKDGFIVHSKAFDGLKGDFPIGFLIWKTNQQSKATPITSINVDVLDKNANHVGEKEFYNLPSDTYLNKWIERPKSNKQEVIALKNAVSPYTAKK